MYLNIDILFYRYHVRLSLYKLALYRPFMKASLHYLVNKKNRQDERYNQLSPNILGRVVSLFDKMMNVIADFGQQSQFLISICTI